MVAAVAVLFPYAAQADRNPVTETKSLQEWTTLTPTVSGTVVDPVSPAVGVNAPKAGNATIVIDPTIPVDPPVFFPFKSGSVDLNATLRSGTTKGTIAISVSGYTAGTYTVSAVTESSSSTVVLGTLTVTTGSFSYPPPVTIEGGSGVIMYIPAHNNVMIAPWGFSTGNVVLGGSSAPFPAGFSPFDIATLSLSDSNNNIVAASTLTPVPNGFYSALSPLVSGTVAPGATGYALIRAHTPPVFYPMTATANATSSLINGVAPIAPPIVVDPLPPIFRSAATGRLVIHAQGLPASTQLTYAVDGNDLGTATTDSAGNLIIFAAQGTHRKLPATLDLFSVKTVTVHDASGTVYVSASF